MKKIQKDTRIDFVVTWVDGSDPKWLQEKAKYDQNLAGWENSPIRYRDWGTVKYWFRALERNAPWVNHVYFVTYGHTPKWLKTNKYVTVVKHSDFIPAEFLPTFNSNSIELNLHKINGLEDHFVYFNDDVFLNAPVKQTDFFKGDMPTASAGFDCIRGEYNKKYADINNAKVLNGHFRKSQILKKNYKKILSIKNGKFLMKTLLLMPWGEITGMAETHTYFSYRKKDFEKLWKMEPLALYDTCKNRIRGVEDVNHWLIKDWYICEGDFYPKTPNFGKSFTERITKKITDDIKNSKHKIICINDYECSQEEFEEDRLRLISEFDKKYPDKSKYETGE